MCLGFLRATKMKIKTLQYFLDNLKLTNVFKASQLYVACVVCVSLLIARLIIVIFLGNLDLVKLLNIQAKVIKSG